MFVWPANKASTDRFAPVGFQVAQADVLVGPAGGNLVNLLFMRPGAKVLELLSHNATAGPTDTEQLCRIAGLQYGRLMPARDWERKLQPIFEAPGDPRWVLCAVWLCIDTSRSVDLPQVFMDVCFAQMDQQPEKQR